MWLLADWAAKSLERLAWVVAAPHPPQLEQAVFLEQACLLGPGPGLLPADAQAYPGRLERPGCAWFSGI